MKSIRVVDIYNGLKKQSINIWLDGGWGVDALLEKQTRDHSDLDIVIQEKDLAKAINFCNEKGFFLGELYDRTAWNFVMNNKIHEKIDFHVININSDGNGIYGPKENGKYYPQESLEYGCGIIDGVEVNVLSPEYQVISHSGYVLKEKDIHDIELLCEKFSIKIPM